MGFVWNGSWIDQIFDAVRRRLGPPEPWWTPPPGLVIRVPTEEEAPLLEEIFRRSWMGTYGGSFDAEPRAALEQMGKLREQLERLCAVVDGRLVGFIDMVRYVHEIPRFRKTLEAEIVYVPRLYVDPDFQCRGIGTELLLAIREYYARAGWIGLNIKTGVARVEAFYRRLRFQTFGFSNLEITGLGPIQVANVWCPIGILPRSQLPKSALTFQRASVARAPEDEPFRGIDGPLARD